MNNAVDFCSISVVPVKAGIHLSVARAAEAWVPAFAGTTA